MKLSPMVIQGLWEFKSPLLQLPYITEEHLRFFMTKKRHIKNLQQFAQLKLEESRLILKNLSDFEFDNIIRVLGTMPSIDFNIRCEVIDDENTNVVTAGAIVTVTVTLVRKNLKEFFGDTTIVEKQSIKDDEEVAETVGDVPEDQAPAIVKKPAWVKQSKKTTKPKTKPKGGYKPKTVVSAVKPEEKKVKKEKVLGELDGESGNESDTEMDEKVEKDYDSSDGEDDNNEKKTSAEDEDVEWEKYVLMAFATVLGD